MLTQLKYLFLIVCLGISINAYPVGSLEIPSGLIYTKENPQLEFNHFKLYDKSPNNGNAVSTDIFPRSKTTFIYADIEVKNLLYKIKDHEYKMTFKFFLENGKRLGERSSTFLIEKNWEFAWYYESWGWDKPGNWPLGTHRVEIWIDDTKFAIKKFTVVPK